MALGGLSEMLGMGLVIQLRNMFTIPAQAVERSSRSLTNTLVGNQKTINDGFRNMMGGVSLMFMGTSMYAGLGLLTKHAMTASNQLELLRKQIRLLARDNTVGDNLYNQLKQFSTTTPFTIDQVFGAGKNLLAFGFTADRVMQQLKLTGEWASMMNIPITEAAAIIGKIRTGGIAMAMRRLQVSGISYADIAKAGGPIDPKAMRTIQGANPEQFLAAVNRVIESKFSGGMRLYMTTLPGMMTNFRDQLIMAAASIGDQIKPAFKQMLMDVLSVFRPELILPFAKAVGEGLLWIFNMLKIVLVPLGAFITWIMALSNEHPNVIRLGMVFIFLTGTLLNLAGAAMVVMGAFRVLQFLMGAEQVLAIGESLLAMAGPIGWIAAAMGLLYIAWRNNFSGIRDVLTGWWNTVTSIAGGVIALLTSLSGGVGYMSKDMYDSISKSGLLGTVELLFSFFYRMGAFLRGVWDAIYFGIEVLAALGSAVLWVTYPVWKLLEGLWDIAKGLGWVGNLMGSSTWHTFGVIVGDIATTLVMVRIATVALNTAMLIWRAIMYGHYVILGLVNAATWAWNAATKALTVAQWALDVAMDANPIGLIIVGIGLLIVGIAALIINFDKVANWFKNLPVWGKALVQFLGNPLFGLVSAAVAVYNHWDQIKQWFQGFGEWLTRLWDVVIDYLWNKITSLWNWLKGVVTDVSSWFTDSDSKGSYAMAGGAVLTPSQLNQLAPPKPMPPPQFTQDAQRNHGTVTNFKSTPQPIVVHTNIHLDGRQVAKSVTKHMTDRHDGDNN